MRLRNEGYQASLERQKLYQVVSDSASEKHQLLRIIGESGDDYLYPEGYFLAIKLPKTVESP